MTTRIGFHANALTLRGTEVALYDYAQYNELTLGNESVVFVPRVSNHDQKAIPKFTQRFPVIHYDHISQLDDLLQRENCKFLYCIKYGVNDGVISRVVPTGVHCVFNMTQPHGNVYAAVSDFISRKYGGIHPVVPHMVDVPAIDENIRPQLNIPNEAIVFGRHGGFETFDLDFAKSVITSVVDERRDIFFVFLYTQRFINHPQVKFLEPSSDVALKARFINSCDAMIHARKEGETFGLACAEFSVRNKPVITYANSEYTQHLDILGPLAFTYRTSEDLRSTLLSFKPQPEKSWDAYSEKYSPTPVIERFRKVFLEPFGICQKRVPAKTVEIESEDNSFIVVENDNLSKNFLRGEKWEPHITSFMRRAIDTGSCIVDVGASLGFHTVTASKIAGSLGKVYAFEPQRQVFELLIRNVLRNNCGNVRLCHAAVAHQLGTVTMNPVDYSQEGVNLGDVYITKSSPSGETVRTIKIDTAPIPERISLIKIDVQGAERFVLEGGQVRIGNDRPLIVIEVEEHCLQRFGYTSEVLFQLIRRFGYEIFFLEYPYPSDHVCVPQEQLVEFTSRFTSEIRPLDRSNELNHNLECGVTLKLSLFPAQQ